MKRANSIRQHYYNMRKYHPETRAHDKPELGSCFPPRLAARYSGILLLSSPRPRSDVRPLIAFPAQSTVAWSLPNAHPQAPNSIFRSFSFSLLSTTNNFENNKERRSGKQKKQKRRGGEDKMAARAGGRGGGCTLWNVKSIVYLNMCTRATIEKKLTCTAEHLQANSWIVVTIYVSKSCCDRLNSHALIIQLIPTFIGKLVERTFPVPRINRTSNRWIQNRTNIQAL